MVSDRVLDTEGVHNFRDYGGYRVSGGGRLRRGMLWRSGQHHGATDRDLEKIAGLGLSSVFDLRTSHERDREPCRRPEGFSARVHVPDELDDAAKALRTAPHIAAARNRGQRSAEETRAGMVETYRTIAFRPELVAIMRRKMVELAQGNGPSLVNCMAGKDRTGTTVAIVHLATGVHRDDVIADYLLTNTAGDVEARIAAGARTVRGMSRDIPDDVIRVIMGVEAEYIETALASMVEQHGSTDAYLEQVLGVDAAMRDRLIAQLVEG
jgi:protein tyrosine/serine phosphatase